MVLNPIPYLWAIRLASSSCIKTSGDVCKLLLKKKYLADVVSGWTPKNECPKADYMDEETPRGGCAAPLGYRYLIKTPSATSCAYGKQLFSLDLCGYLGYAQCVP